MAWPLSQDYNEAIQSPASNFVDPDLRCGTAVANALGIPQPCSGNFADVYQVRCPDGGRWAVKCFTREVPGLRERYQEISRHLRQAKLPFGVDFSYLEQGIRVAGRWYPALKMQWVEGLTLNQFVGQYLDKPAMLEALLRVWVRMAKFLRAAEVAHGDLQHGNVLLVSGVSANALALKLIDYDGLFVPALANHPSGEVGHPCYQHPQRLGERSYGAEVDRFPLLLVATALACLIERGRPLWEKYDTGDNLLFRQADLQAPTKSVLFHELFKLTASRARQLVEHTFDALRGRLESVPLVEDLLKEEQAEKPASPPPLPWAKGQAGPSVDQLGRVACPNCRAEVYYNAEMAGQIVACPYCERPFRAPSMPDAAPDSSDPISNGVGTAAKSNPAIDPWSGLEPDGAARPRGRARKRKRRMAGIWVVGGVAIIALVAGIGLRPLVWHPSPQQPTTSRRLKKYKDVKDVGNPQAPIEHPADAPPPPNEKAEKP